MKKCLGCNAEVDDKAYCCPKCGGTTLMGGYSAGQALSILGTMKDQSKSAEHVDRSAQLFAQGRLKEAIAELDRALEIAPMNPTAHGNMGVILLQQGKPKEAIPWLERALELNPNLGGIPRVLAEAKAAKTGNSRQEKLDFSFPEKKSEGGAGGAFTVLLLLVAAALAAANLFVTLSERKPAPMAGGGLSTEHVKDLASKLAQRNLYSQAAATWQDYLATARLTGPEQAKIHFQIGGLLEKAGLYGDAIEHYYRSEAAAKVEELGPQINAHVKECFERLGKFSALRYELMDRTSIDATQPAGGKVVAEIGAEKITESQLDALIEESIDDQLTPMRAFMTPEQLNEQKKRASEQLRSPQAKQEFLQNWLAQEILYRQALDQQLGDKPEVKRFLHGLTRQALSRQMLDEQLASKIHITDTDVQTYYTANKDKYVEPAKAKISHIVVADDQKADELLRRLREGEDFAEIAEESSLDQATKDNGGKVAADVQQGSYVPGIGDANEINASIFAAEGPKLLDKPFKTDKGWEIVRVDEKHSPRPKTFDEVRQQVMRELLSRKSEEVQRDYLKELMDQHKVVVHTSVLAPAQQEPAKEASPKP